MENKVRTSLECILSGPDPRRSITSTSTFLKKGTSLVLLKRLDEWGSCTTCPVIATNMVLPGQHHLFSSPTFPTVCWTCFSLAKDKELGKHGSGFEGDMWPQADAWMKEEIGHKNVWETLLPGHRLSTWVAFCCLFMSIWRDLSASAPEPAVCSAALGLLCPDLLAMEELWWAVWRPGIVEGCPHLYMLVLTSKPDPT